MAIIDVGTTAINRASTAAPTYTFINLDNPANETGTINTVELWANTNITGLKIALFYLVSGTDYAVRSVTTIGNVTSGSKQTLTGLSLNVTAGDLIGAYWATGTLERDTSGGNGFVFLLGDQTGTTATYTLATGNILSLYGTGVTAATGNTTNFFQMF